MFISLHNPSSSSSSSSSSSLSIYIYIYYTEIKYLLQTVFPLLLLSCSARSSFSRSLPVPPNSEKSCSPLISSYLSSLRNLVSGIGCRQASSVDASWYARAPGNFIYHTRPRGCLCCCANRKDAGGRRLESCRGVHISAYK